MSFDLCPTCHGDGVVTLAGFSVSPGSGIPVSDPQEAHDEPCPDCDGSGILASDRRCRYPD